MIKRFGSGILPHAWGIINSRSLSVSCKLAMKLQQVVAVLERYAPLSLAESWDNVGLLVEPSGSHTVKSLLLTNDLTEPVLQEALDKKVNMIISYHPPIFSPLKRLTTKTFKERIIVRAIEERIAIYSPHTAFDAVKGGVNDWLASGLGAGTAKPLTSSVENSPPGCSCNIIATIGTYTEGCKKTIEMLQSHVANLDGVGSVNIDRSERLDGSRCHKMSILCSEISIPGLQSLLMSHGASSMEIYSLRKAAIPGTGSGRLFTLDTPIYLMELISHIKTHLQLKKVRLARAQSEMAEPLVSTVALCAGSGASVLRGVKADVFLTGEMSHHEILEAVSRGTHVVLCEHSNTERGFLSFFQGQLQELLECQVDVLLSARDADPLQIV